MTFLNVYEFPPWFLCSSQIITKQKLRRETLSTTLACSSKLAPFFITFDIYEQHAQSQKTQSKPARMEIKLSRLSLPHKNCSLSLAGIKRVKWHPRHSWGVTDTWKWKNFARKKKRKIKAFSLSSFFSPFALKPSVGVNSVSFVSQTSST